MSPLSCPLPFPQPHWVYRMLLLQNSNEVRNSQMKKEPCLSGLKAKTSEVDAFPPCLCVHRELSSGPCTETTTVIYPKEVNNVDYLFNYCYFYYCFPLVESTAVVSCMSEK